MCHGAECHTLEDTYNHARGEFREVVELLGIHLPKDPNESELFPSINPGTWQWPQVISSPFPL